MIRILTFIALLASFQSASAGRCACTAEICPPLDKKYAESEAVYLAEIISAKPAKGEEKSGRPLHKIELKVLEIFKGSPSDIEIAYSHHDPLDDYYVSSIDIRIFPGTQYIIFKRPAVKVNLGIYGTYHGRASEEVMSFIQEQTNGV